MRFELIDSVLEVETESGNERLRAVKQVSLAEEYLADHFPTFPVLPGVLMVEAMVQACRALSQRLGCESRLVLGSARAVKFGSFVAPGDRLEVAVSLSKRTGDVWSFKGEGLVSRADQLERAVSGRLELRPVRLGS